MFSDLLKIVGRLAPGSTSLIISPGDKGCILYAATEFNQVKIKSSLKIENLSKTISVPFASLEAALYKKKDETISIDKDETLVIKEKNTRLSIQLGEVSGSQSIDLSAYSNLLPLNIENELWMFLTEKLPLLKIEKVHETMPDFRLYLSLTDKSTVLAVVDGVHQMSFIRAKKSFGETRGNFNIPYDRFLGLLKSVPYDSMKMKVGEDVIIMSAGNVLSVTNTPIFEGFEGDIFKAISDKITALEKFDGSLLVIDKAQLSNFLTSTKAIAMDDSRVIFNVAGGKVKCSVVTTSGKSELIIKPLSPCNDIVFALEIKHLKTLIGKSVDSDNIEMRIGEGEIVLKGSIGYVGSLSEVQ